jgi:hypothetical protein
VMKAILSRRFSAWRRAGLSIGSRDRSLTSLTVPLATPGPVGRDRLWR